MRIKPHPGLYVFVVLFAIWFVPTHFGLVSELLVPNPLSVFVSMYEDIYSSALWIDIWATTRRALISLILSASISIPLGVLIGRSENLEKASRFLIDFTRSIPATALFPIFLVFFGVSDTARVGPAVIGASLLILVNTISGIKNSNSLRIRAAESFGASGIRLYFYVLIPEALPQITTGIRLAASLVLVINILVEMFIGATNGIGSRIIDSQMIFDIPRMYASIIFVGLIGYVINMSIIIFEKRYIHYAGH